MPAAPSQNLTILLTDIKGFTEKTSHKTRADILRMLEKHKEIVLPVLESRGGRLVKTIGDAFLVVFDSPTDGVLAGVAVQEALAAFNKDKSDDERIDVRIAINAGEVNIVDNDIFGEPVNIVSRIEGIAEAGEVFFTEAVYLAMNKQEVPSSEVGDRQLKGIAQKVKVYKVLKEDPVEELPPPGGPGPVHAAPAKVAPAGALAGAVSEPRPKAWVVEPAGAAAPAGQERPSALRRAVALLIDAVICGILVGALAGGEKTQVQVRRKTSSIHKTSKVKRSAPAVEMGNGGIKVPGVEISDKGIKIPGMEISDKGIKLPGVEINDDGILLGADPRGAGAPSKTGTKPTVVAAPPKTEEQAREEALEHAEAHLERTAKDEPEDADGKDEDEEKDAAEEKDEPEDAEEKDEPGEEGEDGGKDSPWEVKTVNKKESPAFAIFWTIYSALFLLYWGATPGKKILKLKVVQMDGRELEKKQAVLRSVFTIVSGTVLFLGFLWALFEKDGRGWHDLIAGTKVVRTV